MMPRIPFIDLLAQNRGRFLDRAITAATGAALGILIARNFFISEKKIIEPIRPDFRVGEPGFERAIVHLLGAPLMGGNRVKLLRNGREIFPAMLEAIEKAQRSITFENFVWWEGEITQRFARALAERARAGVKVHFLQDAFGTRGLRGPSMDVVRASPVHLEVFRLFGLARLNQRTHRKLLVVDGRVGFIGGVGVADEWDGDADRSNRWRDMQYQVEGPAVAQMQHAFIENWMETRGCVLHGDDYFPELKPVGSQECQVFKSSATDAAENARLLLLLSIASAAKSIRIANAYFVPDTLTIQMLLEARRRGVEIEVIGPGPLIDQRLVRQVGRRRWRDLLAAGVRFYEFEGCLFHCKYLIVDDCWSSVGSMNIDNRSLRLNDEANLNVLDRDFAAEHLRVFEEDKKHSRRITQEEWDNRPMTERARAAMGELIRSQL